MEEQPSTLKIYRIYGETPKKYSIKPKCGYRHVTYVPSDGKWKKIWIGRIFKALDILLCLLIFSLVPVQIQVYLAAVGVLPSTRFAKKVRYHCRDATMPISALYIRSLMPYVSYRVTSWFLNYIDETMPGPYCSDDYSFSFGLPPIPPFPKYFHLTISPTFVLVCLAILVAILHLKKTYYGIDYD